jgi:VWFA-related protein
MRHARVTLPALAVLALAAGPSLTASQTPASQAPAPQAPAAQAPAAQAPATPPTQPSQPIFRAGVELLAVDVTALDNDGRQVSDLTAGEFSVEVDGNARKVASAEFVPLVDPRRPTMTLADRKRAAEVADRASELDPYVSSNSQGAPPGRLIMLLFDQGNILAGSGRQIIDQARRFIDAMQPEDRIALAAIPAPGQFVEFTTDHDSVKEALLRTRGTARVERRRFNISMTEAIAIYQNSDARLAQEVFSRECGLGLSAFEAERCEREMEQQASEYVSEMRQQAADSISAIRAVFRGLATIEGTKQVIMISQGLFLEHLTSDVDDLAGLAADARASIDILMLDVATFDAAQAQRPTTPRDDRRLQEEGLEALAGLARGGLFRINASANYAFERITRALAGYYLIGVEARPEDRDGRRHRISVKTSRRGVSLRSRRSFLTGLSGAAGSPTEAVSRAIRAPLASNDLPMRLATWTFKEPGSTKIRLIVAVEVERLADQPLSYTTGVALIDRANKAFIPDIASQTLGVGDDAAFAHYATSMMVEPGSNRVKVAMSDSEGRVGSVERPVDAFHVDGTSVAVGDLLLGPLKDGGNIEPTVEPRVAGQAMAAMLEAYVPAGVDRSTLSAALEVVRTENGPVLATIPMQISPRPKADVTTVQAVINTAALPPGRYLARATFRESGKAKGHFVRPFVVAAGAAASTVAAADATLSSSAAAAVASLPREFASALVEGIPPFDQKELLAPAVMNAALTAAASRGAASKTALQEARAGKLGPAAMTALTDGDQALAAFLKGLDLLSQGQSDRAAVQFQTSMQQAPQFAPARLYLGAAFAGAKRHKEAAGLFQSGATADGPSLVGRLAGEEWLRAGDPNLALASLEKVASRADDDPRTGRALGLALVLSNRAPEAVPVLSKYLTQNPSDSQALLAGIYAIYSRHAGKPQADTLGADRTLAGQWLKSYAPQAGPMEPLVTAWVKYLDDLK